MLDGKRQRKISKLNSGAREPYLQLVAGSLELYVDSTHEPEKRKNRTGTSCIVYYSEHEPYVRLHRAVKLL